MFLVHYFIASLSIADFVFFVLVSIDFIPTLPPPVVPPPIFLYFFTIPPHDDVAAVFHSLFSCLFSLTVHIALLIHLLLFIPGIVFIYRLFCTF